MFSVIYWFIGASDSTQHDRVMQRKFFIVVKKKKKPEYCYWHGCAYMERFLFYITYFSPFTPAMKTRGVQYSGFSFLVLESSRIHLKNKWNLLPCSLALCLNLMRVVTLNSTWSSSLVFCRHPSLPLSIPLLSLCVSVCGVCVRFVDKQNTRTVCLKSMFVCVFNLVPFREGKWGKHRKREREQEVTRWSCQLSAMVTVTVTARDGNDRMEARRFLKGLKQPSRWWSFCLPVFPSREVNLRLLKCLPLHPHPPSGAADNG